MPKLLTILLLAAMTMRAQIPSTINATLFQNPRPLPAPAGRTATHLVAAEFTGDRIDDVAAVWSTGGFSIFSGAASGEIKLERTFDTAPFNVTGLVAADFNGDSRIDIVISREDPNVRPRNAEICYYQNSATGFLATPNRCQSSPYRVVEADNLNGDRLPDLAGHNPENGTLGVFFGSGFGNFRLIQEFPRVNPGGPLMRQAMVDLNADGRAELIYLDDRTIRILLNDPALELLVPGWTYEVPGRDGALFVADFNRDGRPDLLARSTNGTQMQEQFFLGVARVAPFFQLGRSGERDPAQFPVGVFLFDFDQDGLPDITAAASDGFFVQRNLGSLNFRRVAQANVSAGVLTANGFLLAPGDFNGDGRLDYVTLNPARAALEVLLGRPVTRASAVVSVPRPELVYGERIVVSARAVTPVFPPFGIPRNGRVEFRSGATVLARVNLRPGFEPAGPPPEGSTLELGVADAEVTLPAGPLEVTAVLDAGPLWEGGVSEPARANVQPAPVTLNLIGLPGRLNRGQALRFDVEARAIPATVVAGRLTAAFSGTGVTAELRNGRASLTIPTDEAEEGAQTVSVRFEGANYQNAVREAFVTVQPNVVTGPGIVSSASLQNRVAPDSLAILRIAQLFTTAATATTPPWPTELNNTSVRLTDESGNTAVAPLSFVGPGQINLLVPAEVVPGKVRVSARTSAQLFEFDIEVAPVAPALFTANNNGRGVPAATAVRVNADGQETPVEVVRCAFACVPAPINLGVETDSLILTLNATGIRRASELKIVSGEETLDVLGVEPHPVTPGRDLVRVRLPRAWIGRGNVDLLLTADGAPSNTVSILIE